MSKKANSDQKRPKLSSAGRAPTHEVGATDQSGTKKDVWIPGETPLTIRIDDQEIVTLMTLGTHPEELALGYLRNQRLIEDIEEIASVTVDWEKEMAKIATRHGRGISDLEERLSKITVTSGCGQGTVFSCTIDKIFELKLPQATIRQSTIYRLLKKVAKYNRIYRQAGSVHGCGLCHQDEVVMYVEDVGRHNAADTISGRMWLDRIPGEDKILFSTGRLTSEIVLKAAQMRIPVLISRSGVTHMGLDIAQDLGITMIGRVKAKNFLVYSGAEGVVFDSKPSASG
jgi:FdhD protein